MTKRKHNSKENSWHGMNLFRAVSNVGGRWVNEGARERSSLGAMERGSLRAGKN